MRQTHAYRPRTPRAWRWIACLVALIAATTATANQRIALVIGNNAYSKVPLHNPVNDARAVSERLAGLGFEIIKRTDANREDMEAAIVEFSRRIEDGATAMVFYAGHGIQANGRNYLVPTDAKLESERELRFEAIDVADLLEELEYSPSSINLVVLDACRNNPFGRFRGGGRGLAPVDAAAGTLVAYATAPGSTASDGWGENGLYTQEFLNALARPGLKVEEVFKQVRIQVADLSDGEQIPWESSSLTGDFVFNQSARPNAPVTSGPAAGAPVASRTGSDAETVFWTAIADSHDAAQFDAYLKTWPDGSYAELARVRRDALEHGAIARGCGDLTGRWLETQSRGNCQPILDISRDEHGGYRFKSSNCYASGGPVTLTAGNRMHIAWAGVPCKGVTWFDLTQDCSAGEGETRVQGPVPLVCGGRWQTRVERLLD